MEVTEMLKKLNIAQACHHKGEFLNCIFLVRKRMGGNQLTINLKKLNSFLPNQHFKTESLYCLKFLLLKDDYICQIDLKDSYFSVTLHKDSQKLVEESSYEFLLLCFGLGPAPIAFTKLLKVPISVLRRLIIRVIFFLENLLILGKCVSCLLLIQSVQGMGYFHNRICLF